MLSGSLGAELLVGITDAHPGALDYVSGKFEGALANEYQCSLDSLKEPYRVIKRPQARILNNIAIGEVDIALPLAKTSGRSETANFAKAVFVDELMLLTKSPFEDPSDHPKKRFSLVRTASYHETILERGGSVIPVESYESALKMLLTDRVDATVVPSRAIEPYLELISSLNQQVYVQHPVGMYVKQSRPDLLAELNVTISECLKEKRTN